MQSRRSFIQRTSLFLGALAVSGSTMLLTACASVVNDLLTAFQTILNILSAAGLVPGGALVATALSNVIADVQAYEAAPAADKATLGEKLALVIQIAEAQLQTWFTGLGLTGTLAVIIESLVGVILSTLAGLLPTLPVPPTVPAEIVAARSLAHQITFKPVATITLTKGGLDKASKQFRSQFNGQLTANGYAKTF
jgi:hypothetical protein